MRSASLSRLLTAACTVAILGACNGSSGGTGGPGGDGNPSPNTPKSPPPQSLQGQWLNGTISPLWFWDENSQMVQNGGGTAAYFVFKADGSYEEFLYASFTSGGSCRYLSWSYTEGTATFEEGTFHIYPTKGRSKYSDCTHGSDFDKSLSADELKKAQKVYYWKFQAQADGTSQLMMGPNETSLSLFQKAP